MMDEGGQESLTPFQFGYNDPVRYNDPDGKCPMCIPALVVLVDMIGDAVAAYAAYKTAQAAAPHLQKAIEKTGEALKNAPPSRMVMGSPLLMGTADYSEAQTSKSSNSAASAKATKDSKEIVIDGTKHPQAAQHALDAQANGSKTEGVVDRKGKGDRRKENLKGKETQQGKDRDEFPPAVIKTDGPVSVRLIDSGDNRGAGSSLGRQLKNVPDNTRVVIRIIPPKKS